MMGAKKQMLGKRKDVVKSEISDKWIKFILDDDFPMLDAIKWCQENCQQRFHIKKKPHTMWSFKPKASFQNEIDAMAFKLRWL